MGHPRFGVTVESLLSASANRRQRLGPTDRALTLLRFDRGAAPPVDLVSFGDAALVGTPCDLGVTVAQAIKKALR